MAMRSGPKRVNAAIKLVAKLASFKDPRDCPSWEDEIEVFARVIREAKRIYGDLHEGDDECPAR